METLIVVLLGLNIVLQVITARALTKIILESANRLDYTLAGAIQTAFEQLPESLGGLVGSIEPPNMIQQALAQIIQQRINPDLVVKEVKQGPDGKFVGDTS